MSKDWKNSAIVTICLVLVVGCASRQPGNEELASALTTESPEVTEARPSETPEPPTAKPEATLTATQEPTSTGTIGLRVLGVTASPLAVTPGQELRMTITYEVLGVQTGRVLAVSEKRVIMRDGRELAAFDAQVQREAGIHQSSQKLLIPGDLEHGVFELRGYVVGGSVDSSGKTLFEVRSP